MHRSTWLRSLIPLLLSTTPLVAEPGPTLAARLAGLDAESDLEDVMLALARGGPLDLRASAIAAGLGETECRAPTPLLAGAERLQVRCRPDRVEARVLRAEASRAEAPWRGAGPRQLTLETLVLWRVEGGKLVEVRGVIDQGPLAVPEPPAAAGFVDLLGGERRGGPSAEEALEPQPPPPPGDDRTAVFERTDKAGRASQMKSGTLTINGNRYAFRSGGYGQGNLPPGEYTVTPHRWSRSEPGYTVDGVGWTVALSDAWDPRVGKTRDLLRIHPDGNRAGTEGCIGIVGDGATMRAAREDLRAELARGGGSFTLVVR